MSCREREPTYGWMDCVPYSVKDLDIYALGLLSVSNVLIRTADSEIFSDVPYIQEVYSSSITNTSDFNDITGGATQFFAPQIDWNLHDIASNCADWICEGAADPNSNSRAWMLSSVVVESLLSGILTRDLCKALRVTVGTSFIIYDRGDYPSPNHLSSSYLWIIRAFAGSQVLRKLDAVLNTGKIAKASIDELKAIFLLLFGTVIAVGYTGPRIYRKKVNKSDQVRKTY